MVGTRVINASKDDLLASLRHLQPMLTKLGDAGDSLARRPVDAGQLPVPQGGRRHRPGRLRQRLFQMDINLNNLIKSPGDVLPNLIDLCGALPPADVCQALSPEPAGDRVRAARTRRLVDARCARAAARQAPGSSRTRCRTSPGLPGSSGSSGTSGGGGGLGGLLGGGGGG